MRARQALTACALLLAGCAHVDLERYRTVALSPDPLAPEAAVNWQGISVRTGQIIVMEKPSAMSLVLSFIGERYSPYTHAGIIVVEDGAPQVYEAMAVFMPLPWRKPNEKVGGGVRRVALESFLARGGIVAIHEPGPEVDREAVARFARAHVAVPFDSHYDPRDSSRFYCAEFVARALEYGHASGFSPMPTTRNASLRVLLDWLDITAPEILFAGDLIDERRRVALLSREFTAVQIARYFALKKELHRRFTADQRLGNAVYWRRQNLHFRPAVDRYFEAGMVSDRDPLQLAEELLGPMRDGLAVTRNGTASTTNRFPD